MILGDNSSDEGVCPVDGDILGDDSAEEACEWQRVELRMKFRREGPVFIVAFFPAWLDFGKIGSSLLRRRSVAFSDAPQADGTDEVEEWFRDLSYVHTTRSRDGGW